jgi:hypothetical protein
LGIALGQLGRYHEALAALDAAQKLDPQNPLIYFYQGVVSHELKAFNQSPALFSRAMALSPDLTPSARYYTGMSYYERGLLDQAQREFEGAIALGEPESELARTARAILEQRMPPPSAPKRWDLNLSLSGQYDTNVVLLPIGVQPPGGSTGISQKDDFRMTVYARGEYRPIQTADWTAGISYGFYQSLHQKLTTFDIQDHAPSVFVQRQLGIRACSTHSTMSVSVKTPSFLLMPSSRFSRLRKATHTSRNFNFDTKTRTFRTTGLSATPSGTGKTGWRA